METTELRRSTLERKDRDELTTIATALGAKVPSRARKSEIVDMILTMATTDVVDEASEPEPETESPEAVDVRDTSAAEPDDEEFDFGEATTPTETKSKNSRKKSSNSKGNGDSKSNGDSKGQADAKGNGDQNQSNNGDDQPERGNRRSRRRGRGGRDQRDQEAWDGSPVTIDGLLDLRDDGYGFLRVNGVQATKDDAYVSVKQVRQFGLRKGDRIIGMSRPANRNEKNPALLSIDTINGRDPEKATNRADFDSLTAVSPNELLVQEIDGESDNTTARIIDLIAPIGKGQRGLIVSPPNAGKTSILKSIAHSVETNNPEAELIVLMIDERPEDITEMQRSVEKGDVVASPFDRPADEHVALADITIERAKRLVELGHDVVVLFDGVTRLVRATNSSGGGTGRMLGGVIDSGALYSPKRLFGAARRVDEGGSLTIVATLQVESGSSMDAVILEEFSGAANHVLRLDNNSAERRTWPAIDVNTSATRNEDQLIVDDDELAQVAALRNVLADAHTEELGSTAALDVLLKKMAAKPTNEALLADV